ncbi:MAG: adenylyltransferase/cytidyltransferase family protein [Methanobacteriota archaeon]
MVRVMASGVFDLLHLGHIHYLQEARNLGDELVVVVATDATVRKRKHEPVTPGTMRLEMVESLKVVDRAVLGKEGDMFAVVEEIKPDIIALGYDQELDETWINEECAKRRLSIKVVRLPKMDTDLDATRKIIHKVIEWFAVQQYLKQKEGQK